VQLNVEPEELVDLDRDVAVVVGGDPHTAHRVGTFAELGPGQLGLIVDSYGLVAVALDRDSAARAHDVVAGSEVLIRSLDDERPVGLVSPVTLSIRRTSGEGGAT
jgi:S-adenosylmethionine hydrolase